MNGRLSSFLASLCLVSLALTVYDVQAIAVEEAETKNQSFNPAGKLKGVKPSKKFSQLDTDAKKFGDVKFKAKPLKNGKKKPAAVFNFGEPTSSTAGGHTVSVEMVSLSLISMNPVSLDPFLGKGSGQTGDIVLSLLAPALNSKSTAKLKNDKKGKVDIELKKKFKVSTKKDDVKKSKNLDKKKFKALGVGFSHASPITITDPSFCLESGTISKICLAPMASTNPVPLPGALVLMASALTTLFMGQVIRRRRQNNGSQLQA